MPAPPPREQQGQWNKAAARLAALHLNKCTRQSPFVPPRWTGKRWPVGRCSRVYVAIGRSTRLAGKALGRGGARRDFSPAHNSLSPTPAHRRQRRAPMSPEDERSYADVAAQPSSDPDPDPTTTGHPAPADIPAPAPAGAADPPSPQTSPRSALAKTKRVPATKTAHFDLPATPEAEVDPAGAGLGLEPPAPAGLAQAQAAAPPQPDQNQDDHHPTSSPPPFPPALPHLPVPPTLAHTAHDLKQLIKGFIFLPSFVRRYRTLIPESVRVLARRAIRLLAMVLHKQGEHSSSVAESCSSPFGGHRTGACDGPKG